MQKKLILVLMAAAGVVPAVSYAQSSVTLYGLLDSGVAYVSNQKNSTGGGSANWEAMSGALNSDRWGLRGSEDLGGGLHAIFDLENGFSITSGKFSNGGDEFGRQAWVGLSSNTLGAVTLGRQYDDVVDFVAPLSATGSGFGGNIADHPFDNDNLANDLRLNNAIKFRSIDYSGFSFGGVYALSNEAGEFSNNNAYSLGAGYANGPLKLGVGYLQVNQPGGVDTPMNTSGADSSSDTDSTMTGARQRIFGAAAQYVAGPAQIGLVFTRTILDSPRALAQGGSLATLDGNLLTFSNYELNARYAITPRFHIGGSYTFTNGGFSSGSANISPKWNQFMLQADYNLSKRTDVYLAGTYQRVSGANGVAVLGNASIFNLAASSNDRQAIVTAGLRTRF